MHIEHPHFEKIKGEIELPKTEKKVQPVEEIKEAKPTDNNHDEEAKQFSKIRSKEQKPEEKQTGDKKAYRKKVEQEIGKGNIIDTEA